jgi:ABC-type branched-subunit amino acid transport system ATPase component
VSALSRSFGGIRAVREVSFSVHAGETVGLIGANGAGKTTLFNLLSGADRPDAGQVSFEGRRIDRWPASRIARLGIGRTFQSVRVFGGMTVEENLRVADATGQRSGAALDAVGMRAHFGASADLLSYGQRKLVELAMVLAQAPKLILLDEPVSGVNPAMIEEIAAILARLKEQGQTLLVVEHNIPFVARLCSRVIVMANGGVLAEGRPEDVQKDPRVLESFLGAE